MTVKGGHPPHPIHGTAGQMYRNTANIISLTRIPFGIALLFFPALSAGFFVFYTLGGISDVLDGLVARRTDTDSEIGSKIDSLTDIFFIAMMLIVLLPSLDIPVWLWIWFIVIVCIKAINLICGYSMYGRFVPSHTMLNRIAGALVFIFPFSLLWMELAYSASFVSAVATLAAVQEGHCIRTGVLS